MDRWKRWILHLAGALALALACIAGAPMDAKAIVADQPDIMLTDMNGIADRPSKASGSNLVDNYGGTYASAIAAYTYSDKYEYLLDGKYSRFTSTLYVPSGETSNGENTMTIDEAGGS